MSLPTIGLAQMPGTAGDQAVYQAKGTDFASSQVTHLKVHWGPKREQAQWLNVRFEKSNGTLFQCWFLTKGYPSANRRHAEIQTKRYIIQDNPTQNLEFRDISGASVLPGHGYWPHLLPRTFDSSAASEIFPPEVSCLGHTFTRVQTSNDPDFLLPEALVLELPVHLQIGTRYDTRDPGHPRRFDRSAVELIRSLPEDYATRLDAGQTTFNTPADHVEYIRTQPVFYMGDNPTTMPFPDRLFQSNYLGPNPDYLNEPAVITAFALQQGLRAGTIEPATLSIDAVLNRFYQEFENANVHARPTFFQKALATRSDVDMGTMNVLQSNAWSWDVLISTGAYQLSSHLSGPPSAMVYEGRIASQRDWALFNSATGAQIPTNDQQAWLDMVIGLLRGAARVTDKSWGISIYGQFDAAEIYRALTYAYDLGASYFLFWTSDRAHHIPYDEQLQYSRFIRDYARQHPQRDIERLKRLAEVMILFPPGYTLLSREPMWWVEPLHYEHRNRHGLTIREIFARVAAEIERCYRQGVPYDLAWDLEGLDLSGYREIIRIRENGTISVESSTHSATFNQPRWPSRPAGEPPGLEIHVSQQTSPAPTSVTATAIITERTSPIYFSPRHDAEGVWHNTKVIWQLYGPAPHQFQQLSDKVDEASGALTLELKESGTYKLRVTIMDRAGRSTVKSRTIVAY